ncbi:MAG UNVERIFIED_CONTAM: hypothetical protein LVR18_16935 [Planctomycetaceae bacterium]
MTLNTQGSVLQFPVDAETDITADDLTITAMNVGATTSTVFTAVPDGIDLSVIDLSITATGTNTGTAAFSGSVTGTTTITTVLQTLFIISNTDVAFSDLAPGYATNLALIADRDNDGTGSVKLGTSLTVSGDLRIEGADVTTTRPNGEIYLSADRILFSLRTSETLRLTLTQPTVGQAGSFEGHSQNDLTVFSSTDIILEDLTPGIAPVTMAAAVTAANISITAINSSLTINGAIISTGSGNLSLTGDNGITHNASGDLTTTTTGSITVVATTGNVTMADGTVYTTGSGAVSVTAANNVAVGTIATTASRSLRDGHHRPHLRRNCFGHDFQHLHLGHCHPDCGPRYWINEYRRHRHQRRHSRCFRHRSWEPVSSGSRCDHSSRHRYLRRQHYDYCRQQYYRYGCQVQQLHRSK